MRLLKNKKYIIITLMFIEVFSLFLTYKSFSNKNISTTNEENIVEKNGFAMYVENNETGEYEVYNSSNFFPVGFRLNETKSSCVDDKENVINGLLNYNRTMGSVTISSNKSIHCNLYFDYNYTVADLCESGDNLGSCLTDNREKLPTLSTEFTGGLYRYQGTQEDVTNNYICFGTTDKEECVNNTDTYMYRIMGIDESGQVKLIKREALNEAMAWNSATGVIWPESSLYNNINGDAFLNNTTYVSSIWNEKIALTSWKYGDLENGYEIGVGDEQSGTDLYLLENAWSENIAAKVGLMYAHDYYLAYDDSINCGYRTGNYNVCKTNWLYLWQNGNDLSAPNNNYEWLISRMNDTYSWYIDLNGTIGASYDVLGWRAIRPVFYLTSNELYISGSGSIDDPIMINPPMSEYLLNNEVSGLQKSYSVEGDDLYRYVGDQGNTGINNYICLGADTCESGSDDMYRIIGINPETNEIKVIKETRLSFTDDAGTVTNTFQWHNTNGVTWENSDLYNTLNTTWLNSITFGDLIVAKTWNIGDVPNFTGNTKSTIIPLETSLKTTNPAKAGILSLTDYVMAYTEEGDWASSFYSNYTNNWIHAINNNWSATALEWTMSRHSSTIAWGVNNLGYADRYYNMYSRLSVRPTFFLTSNLQYIKGDGSSINPFIVK